MMLIKTLNTTNRRTTIDIDYADACGFSNAAANVGFVNRRERRKLRHDEKKQLLKEEVTTNEV